MPKTPLENNIELLLKDIHNSVFFIKKNGFENEETIESLNNLVESGNSLIQEGIDLYQEGKLGDFPIVGSFFIGFLGEIPFANFIVKPIMQTQRTISQRKLKASIKQSQIAIYNLKKLTRKQQKEINKIKDNLDNLNQKIPEIEKILARNSRNILIMYFLLFFVMYFVSITFIMARKNRDAIAENRKDLQGIINEKESLIYTTKRGDTLWSIAQKCYENKNDENTTQIIEFIVESNPSIKERIDLIPINEKIELKKGDYILKESSCN